VQETKFLSVNPTDFVPTLFLQGDKSQFIVLHAVDDSVAEEGQSFTCQLVSADNGGVLDSELDEATVHIPANDKVEGVVSIDPSARNIIAGEPMQGYDGVFVVRLVKKQDVYVPFFILDLQSNPAYYRHLIITDSLLCLWGKKALTFSLNSTRLIQVIR